MTAQFVIFGSILLVFLSGCVKPTPTPPVPDSGMVNPASAYCIENGGTLEIRKDEEGNEFGVCLFADGSECEEWAYARGECVPGKNK